MVGTREATVVGTQPGEELLPPGTAGSGMQRRVWEVALSCFGELGYHAVSIRDIACGAGIQPSSVYAHVRSKEELLYDLCLLGHQTHYHRVRDAVLSAGPDPAAQVRAYVHGHVWMHVTYRMLARVANRELGALSDERQARVRRVRDASVGLLLDVIERGAGLGVFDVAEPYLGAAAIGAMGIRVAEWWEPSSPFSSAQLADSYAEFALRILQAPSGAPAPRRDLPLQGAAGSGPRSAPA